MATSEEDTSGIPFTTNAYERLIADVLRPQYEFVGFDDPGPGELVMRHDVDLSIQQALEMARIEASEGVSATYFFLVGSPAYDLLAPSNRRAVEEILDLGHNVGLHFDVHRHWDERPLAADLRAKIEAERAGLERVTATPVEDVSFHVPPEWVLGVDFHQFTSAYAPQYFSNIEYVSDSNQCWRDGHPFANPPTTMQVLIHPGLWHDSDHQLDPLLGRYHQRRVRAVDEYFELLGE